jgi:FkbM family methyltransferase
MKLLIEVGAYDGSDSLGFYNNGYKVYTFEPKKDLYEALVNKTKDLQNYTVIPKAVCLTNGITKFNICKHGGASSILPFKKDEELNNTWTPSRTDIHYSGISYDVETIRLDTFIEQNDLEHTPIDYIHIDAQGVDLECLMSLGKYIDNVYEGVVETIMDVNKSIYTEQKLNTFDNVKKYLEDNNFVITTIQSNDSSGCEYNIYFKKNNNHK